MSAAGHLLFPCTLNNFGNETSFLFKSIFDRECRHFTPLDGFTMKNKLFVSSIRHRDHILVSTVELK